ncbi:MAG: hypothetical protein MJE66_12740, partial [Proteobacteria bacterium]|nr:hypothetical protein [Pseudomonadota bacterium]
MLTWFLAGSASAGVPVTLYQSYAGDLDFTGTAGTFRSQPNTGNACALNPTSSAPLAGIPASGTVRAALLYWAGSGTAIDSLVTLQTPVQTSGVAATRTFTETFSLGGTDYDFFSGFADVTALVEAGRNGTYTLSNLSVNSGAPHCGVQAVLSGWSLIVIYEDAAEPLRVINVFDGLEFFRGSSITLIPDNFVVPPAPFDGKLGHLTWEGDVENSANLNGFAEQLRFEGSVRTDPLNPANNQFNSTVNVIPSTTTFGVDYDVYDVSGQLFPGMTQGVSEYSSGADLVLLSAEIFSVTNTAVADLAVTKSHTGDFAHDVQGTYTIQVSNNGPNTEPGPITVTDTLPAGLAFVSGSGTGWTCVPSGSDAVCTHAGPLANGASLPDLSVTVLPGAAAVPSATNSVTVAGTLFDNVPGNNTDTDPTTVIPPDLSTSTKTVVDPNAGDADPGDVLQYTITVIETAGAQGRPVQVTDDIP